MQRKKIKISPKQSTRATFVPSSYNAEKRTIDVIFTTGARVRRWSWDTGPYYEELSMKKSHVKLERLKAGAPVLNNHGTHEYGGVKDLSDILGVVESARMEGDQGTATLRFSERSDVAELIKDIISGVIRNISVGYVVDEFEEVESEEDNEDGIPVYRAIDWTPMEISFVAIPADHISQTRNKEQKQEHEAILNQREEPMAKKKPVTKKIQKKSAKPKQAEEVEQVEDVEEVEDVEDVENLDGERDGGEDVETPEMDNDEIEEVEESAEGEEDEIELPEGDDGEDVEERSADQIRQDEIDRQMGIRKAVKVAGLDEKFADKLCRNLKVSVKQARGFIFKELEKRSGDTTTNINVEVTMKQADARREAAVRGLLHRSNPTKYPLKQGDNEFVRSSLIDSAKHFLSLEGARDAYRGTNQEIAKRALLTTSDFPSVLSNVSNKSLRDAYEGAPNTYMPFVTETTAKDFKEISSVQISNGGKLEKVNEHGEYRQTTLVESAEKYKVEKFGLILGRTWELIVNDDLGAFTRIPARLGVRAREKENQIFWDLILSNPTMAEDNVALFHTASHGNYVSSSGGAPDITRLGVARKSMRLIKDPDGELSGATPSYIVVPAALETVAEQLLTSITPNTNSNVNPFGPGGRSKLDMIVEPRLDANSAAAWYVFSDKNKMPMAEMARLDGKGPEIFVKEGFEIDGMQMKLRYVFGMKILDWRGFWKNIGA